MSSGSMMTRIIIPLGIILSTGSIYACVLDRDENLACPDCTIFSEASSTILKRVPFASAPNTFCNLSLKDLCRSAKLSLQNDWIARRVKDAREALVQSQTKHNQNPENGFNLAKLDPQQKKLYLSALTSRFMSELGGEARVQQRLEITRDSVLAAARPFFSAEAYQVVAQRMSQVVLDFPGQSAEWGGYDFASLCGPDGMRPGMNWKARSSAAGVIVRICPGMLAAAAENGGQRDGTANLAFVFAHELAHSFDGLSDESESYNSMLRPVYSELNKCILKHHKIAERDWYMPEIHADHWAKKTLTRELANLEDKDAFDYVQGNLRFFCFGDREPVFNREWRLRDFILNSDQLVTRFGCGADSSRKPTCE